MYNVTQWQHLLRESMYGLARRKISGAVAVVIMGSALLMLALFSLITINLDRILQGVRSEVHMSVFLEDAIHPEDRARIEQDLIATEGIVGVRHVSAEEALEVFRVDLGDDAELLDALSVNPLPASFEIRLDAIAQSAQRVEDLERHIAEFPGVEDVDSQVSWLQKLDRVTHAFVVVDLIVGILVLMSALFVISQTVRLTIEESSQQVEIMKLVGATNWFIRMPYLLTGAVQGTLAGALAMSVLYVAVHVVAENVEGIFFFVPGQMVGFVLLSTLLGTFGSMLALRRHLKL